MNTAETIRNRRSVRSFDETPISTEDVQKVLTYAKTADNPYGIPIEWRILDADKNGLSSPVITGTNIFIAGKMQRVPHAEEAFGYSFEKVVIYAGSLGIGTTWIAGTMDRDAFERAIDLSDDEVMPCVSPLGYPAKKMSLRESMMRKGVKADSRISFDELFFADSFDRPLIEDKAGRLAETLKAVRLAPSAVNKQPWRVVISDNKVHFYEKRNRGYTSDDWDIQKIDMGIALCHFELVAKECGLEVAFEINDPGIQVPEGVRYIASYAIG